MPCQLENRNRKDFYYGKFSLIFFFLNLYENKKFRKEFKNWQ